jgi:CheY-like chemotaxis protein
MPIVDGMTSTKMIREVESTSSNMADTLSARANINGRVPIIAVSASLLEAHCQEYINAGFDAWILKPISFARLGNIMEGIVNGRAREQNLYSQGEWEKGGWFAMAKSLPNPQLAEGRVGAVNAGESSRDPQLRAESEETVKAGNVLEEGRQVNTPSALE